ncbi:MAG: 5-aminolevulinate synthase [bacterium]|nr:5-aminolevulinate synthase [bacterium]
MEYQAFFESALTELKKKKEYRFFKEISRHAGNYPQATLFESVGEDASVQTTREISVWCSNDYLGMGQCPEVIEVMKKTLDEAGAGAGGTRNISGTTKWHVALEKDLADFHGKEAALVFTSGYVANETTLRTLGSKLPNCAIVSDEFNHASMIQGIRDARTEKYIFRHNDMTDLENVLSSLPIEQPKIIAFESVYSMNGAMAPLKEIVALAKKYRAFTYLDEVHGVGLYGGKGAGQAEKQGLSDQVDIIQGTLGKAVGLMGGYIAGRKQVIDYVRSFAPGFIFTTSLPPAIAAGACESLKIIRKSQDLRQKQKENVLALKTGLSQADIPFWDSESHIVPVIIGDATKALQLTDLLLKRFNIYVQPINYPTVRRGTERIRLTPSAIHTPAMIKDLVEALIMAWDELSLPRGQSLAA